MATTEQNTPNNQAQDTQTQGTSPGGKGTGPDVKAGDLRNQGATVLAELALLGGIISRIEAGVAAIDAHSAKAVEVIDGKREEVITAVDEEQKKAITAVRSERDSAIKLIGTLVQTVKAMVGSVHVGADGPGVYRPAKE